MSDCYTLTSLKKIANGLNINKVQKFCRGDNYKLYKSIQKTINISPNVHKTDQSVYSNDLIHVMELFMKEYPHFNFMGPFPINVSESYETLEQLNFKKLQKTSKKLAIVWNTDKKYNQGKHWISIFIDFKNQTICYFDSLAKSMPNNIKKILNKIKKKYKQYTIIKNKHKFQKKKGNCGIFVLYFILSRLNGISCQDLYKNYQMIDDELMDKMRSIFFVV